MTIMVFGSTELISCYGQFNKTKKRYVQALAALQYPKPVDLGYGYRKITYKWNRLVRIYDAVQGIVRPGRIESIEEVHCEGFFDITLSGTWDVCLPSETKVLVGAGQYTTLGTLPYGGAIYLANVHSSRASKGRIPLLRRDVTLGTAKLRETPPAFGKVYKITLEDKGEGIGLVLANDLIVT
jgi:hypothetical protein